MGRHSYYKVAISFQFGVKLASEFDGMRFDRMTRTGWIDMQKIHDIRVLVAGAGALGNEVLKNLVLAGFGNIVVADPDIVEESNLSRCVLFRNGDIGKNKAEVAASRAKDLYSGCEVRAEPKRIQQIDLSPFDMFIGCLDNISARLHLNSFAMYHCIPYVDGATDGFRGKVQVILSDGPCMECGINRTHINELHRTFSCDPGKMQKDVDPVTLSSGITTTSIIAAMCVREVLKLTCGKGELCVRGTTYYDGIKGTLETLTAEINPKCPNHLN